MYIKGYLQPTPGKKTVYLQTKLTEKFRWGILSNTDVCVAE